MGSSLALVALSIGVLLAAPGLAAALMRAPRLAPVLDTFVLVSVGGIVGIHVVPQSAALAGPWAVGAAVAGLVLPVALHKLDAALTSAQGKRARDVALLVGFVLGSFVHAFFDGTALAHAPMEPELALGVLLHRLPVGLALWLLVRPKLGLTPTAIVLAALAAGTCAGAVAGAEIFAHASASGLALVQAFVGGSILHVVAESAPFAPAVPASALRAGHDDVKHADTGHRIAGLVGTALAVAVLFALHQLDADHAGEGPHDDRLGAGATFVALAFELAPMVALSFLLVGVLTALYPPAPRLRGHGLRVVDAARGMAAGLPHPLCSCTVAPLYEALLRRGASPAAARAFLVAAPALGVPALLISLRLLGWPFLALRAAGAALLATIVGLSARGARGDTGTEPVAPLGARLSHGLRHGVVDAVDHVGPWLLLGLGAAALLEPALDENSWSHVPGVVQVMALAVAAVPLYLCAAGTTLIAALLVHKGLTVGAALALLLVGPATSIPTLQLVHRRHGARAAVALAALVVGGAVVLGLTADIALAPWTGGSSAQAALHDAARAGPSLVQQVSLLGTVALLGASLVRQGVRGFLLQIMSPQHTHVHDHDHGPGCDHDHGPALLDGPEPIVRSPLSPQPSTFKAPPAAARVALTFDPRAARHPSPVHDEETPR